MAASPFKEIDEKITSESLFGLLPGGLARLLATFSVCWREQTAPQHRVQVVELTRGLACTAYNAFWYY